MPLIRTKIYFRHHRNFSPFAQRWNLLDKIICVIDIFQCRFAKSWWCLCFINVFMCNFNLLNLIFGRWMSNQTIKINFNMFLWLFLYVIFFFHATDIHFELPRPRILNRTDICINLKLNIPDSGVCQQWALRQFPKLAVSPWRLLLFMSM